MKLNVYLSAFIQIAHNKADKLWLPGILNRLQQYHRHINNVVS